MTSPQGGTSQHEDEGLASGPIRGGLIEIKCNEDTVYQKWMWGRIIAMNQWVDVSYSFSHEPPVLKERLCTARLSARLACTKDRSKRSWQPSLGAKKAEELVQRKEEASTTWLFTTT